MKLSNDFAQFRKEEAQICDRCPHPTCKRGICAFYNEEIKKLRDKYAKKHG